MKKIISSITVLSTIAITGAQSLQAPIIVNTGGTSGSGSMGQSLINLLGTTNVLLQMIYGMMFTVGLLMFFAGLFKYLLPGKGAETRREGLQYMGFGILALFVMVGVWGLVGFISGNLGIGVGGDVPTPGIPGRARVY